MSNSILRTISTNSNVPTPCAFSRAREWLLDEALPFWSTRGIDGQSGGYVEQMGFDGYDRQTTFKRVRVIGRQIYVFSHASLLGWQGIAQARHGYEFLVSNAWLGPEHGWARQLNRDGSVKDPTADLYDLAFVLFAFGWFYRASDDPAARAWANRTFDFINTHMRHPSGKGFLVEKPATGPRLQNPHMHLLEAALVNYEATQDDRFKALADEIVDLFIACFFDQATSTLAEYFTEDWSRDPGQSGQLVEPGHQFEWAWILANYQRLTGRKVGEHIEALVRFAERHGVRRDNHLTCNVVSSDGKVLDAGSRVWPNTERIQAAVAMFEFAGEDPRAIFEASTRALFDHFLHGCAAGNWIDRIDADGRTCVDHVPVSTLYHLMIAFAEMLRVERAVGEAFPS
ncbi:mannose/cellobiose epimerase-like protein (N-acyl-D-glucosamine 2-epimerase family) [Sinorhizobium fredii]